MITSLTVLLGPLLDCERLMTLFLCFLFLDTPTFIYLCHTIHSERYHSHTGRSSLLYMKFKMHYWDEIFGEKTLKTFSTNIHTDLMQMNF